MSASSFIQEKDKQTSIISRLRALYNRVDERAVRVMTAHGLRVLRVSLGLVFLWFGLLKVVGVSPVAELVSVVIPWFPPNVSVLLVGLFEVVLGLGLLSGLAIRLTLALFWLHLAGTFLVFVFRPDITFQNGNPLVLTEEGEFIVKNLVLIAGGIAVGSTARRIQKESLHPSNRSSLSKPNRKVTSAVRFSEHPVVQRRQRQSRTGSSLEFVRPTELSRENGHGTIVRIIVGV